MRWLTVRLAVSLAAVAFIGLSLVDVVFVLWLQGHQSGERRLELRVAALEVMEALPEAGTRVRPVLERVAAAHRVAVSLLDRNGDGVRTAPVPLPVHLPMRQTVIRQDGFEHAVVKLHEFYGWRWIVVSRRTDDALVAVAKHHQDALWLFAAATGLMVAAGLLFLRRTVLRPLARVTELVRRGDQAGLSRLSGEDRGPMVRLSQAIIGMSQQLEDDRRHIESQLDEIRAAHRELESTQRQLIRAERLAVVGQLAAGLAHEIGNPLAVLSGYAQMLGDPSLAEDDRAAAISRTQRELDRIHQTVRHLLDYGRAHGDRAADADLSEVLEHLAALLRPQTRMKGIALELPQLCEPMPVALDADALIQVLLNLMLNAADALAGSGRIRLAATAVSESSKSPATRVVVSVEDSGPGIAADIVDRVFDPFFTTKPAGAGTGLGLSICERIVVGARGEITVGDSSVLGGAKITLTLPVPAARAQSAPT